MISWEAAREPGPFPLDDPPRHANRMKTRSRIPLGLCLLTLPSCTPDGPTYLPPERDRITQVWVINALMLGLYDGVMPIPEVLRHGDFGVGTLHHLDGELVVLD